MSGRLVGLELRVGGAEGLSERALAALAGHAPDLSDVQLADLVATSRVGPIWAWLRLGCPAVPPADGPLGLALRRRFAQDAAATVRLRRVIDHLSAAGLEVVLLKGAALSHGVYPLPWLRARNDDDLLIERDRFAAAGDGLTALGYVLEPANPGADETGQAHFTRTFASGDVHHVDLHWRAIVPAAFHALPGPAALRAGARPLPALGAGAWQMAAPFALVMACAHRVAHHAPDEDPIWLVDAHLLAGQLDEAGWDAFADAAMAARVASVCHYELGRAVDRLATPVPPRVRDRLGAVRGEPSARHLHARGRLHRLWLDLGDRSEDRWRALAARVWPSPAYMTARYGRHGARPTAYLWRAGAGAAQWLAEAARRGWSR